MSKEDILGWSFSFIVALVALIWTVLLIHAAWGEKLFRISDVQKECESKGGTLHALDNINGITFFCGSNAPTEIKLDSI